LLDLSDNALMDLVLARKEPEGDIDLPQVRLAGASATGLSRQAKAPAISPHYQVFFTFVSPLQEGRVHEHL
jgi:hypothetical protein